MSSDSPLPESPRIPDGSPRAHCHRVEELWFNDGTVVLVAGLSSFRVYGGLLAKRSPVFHEMLAFRQPEDAEAVEGCPVVYLEDHEDDLRCFLNALFDHEFFQSFPDETTFDTLTGIIRLSTKYIVDSLRKRALVHLSSAFPITLAEYPGAPSWQIPTHDWIRVINFGREMGLDWILPIAFYNAIGNCTVAELLNGISVNGIHVELAPPDRQKCLEQCLSFARAASAEITDFLLDPPSHCREYTCPRKTIKSRKDVEAWRAQGTLPITLWRPEDWEGLAVCQACKSVMKQKHKAALESFWEGLPERFGCPGWNALKQVKENNLT
ncbi:hypothetical protein FB451DRAFT_1282971 [Mycena latifolia]|nr:hypothetical protein FB451DRAFT_1282971 [Mycena latifolia]